MQVYISDRSQARRELDRLKTIEWDLMQKMLKLKDMKDYDSSTWCSIYTERLRDNVRPAIREIQQYLLETAPVVNDNDTAIFNEIFGG